MLTAKEVADLFKITPDTVRKWARTGALPGVILEGVLRFDPKDVKKFIDKGRSR